MASPIDAIADRLHAAEWSIGETCFQTNARPVWQVDGTNGENQLLARSPTQTEAWWLAVEQATATGMLNR